MKMTISKGLMRMAKMVRAERVMRIIMMKRLVRMRQMKAMMRSMRLKTRRNPMMMMMSLTGLKKSYWRQSREQDGARARPR